MDRSTQRPAVPFLVLAVILLLGLVWLSGGESSRGMASYLVGFLFYVTIAVGSLFFVLFQHLTRASWGVTIRRQAEHLASALFLAPVLFVPIALHLERLYAWTDPAVAGHRSVLLNPGAFQLRSMIYLILWALIAGWFRRGSLAQDASGELSRTRRMQSLSAPALIVLGVSLTLAAFDWVMSLSPHWYSTMFGVYFFAGAVVAGFATLSLLVTRARTEGDLSQWVNTIHLHHHGKLLFAFVTFWAYVGFSQFLLIWYANLPEETVWFAARLAGGWRWVTCALVVGHFIVPFALLLSQRGKRSDQRLGLTSCWLLAMHFLDLLWLVVPGVAPEEIFAWSDLLAVGGFGLALIALTRFAARGSAPIPERDPRLTECLADQG